MPRIGRPTIFDKTGGRRVQGLIGPAGMRGFEAARVRLQNLVLDLTGHRPLLVSPSDVIEFLALERDNKALMDAVRRKKR